MSDIERVKELVAEGRITADEGDQLIKVLMEVDDADDAAIDAAYEADIAAADRAELLAMQEAEFDEERPVPAADSPGHDGSSYLGDARRAAATVADAAREAAQTARNAAREVRRGVTGSRAGETGARPGVAIAPAGTKWVTVEMIAGDLDVWAVDGLSGPEVEGGQGNVDVEDAADGYTVKFAPDRGGALDRLLSHFRSGTLRVRIPSDHGLVVKATAGDVDLHGVRYLRGKLTAGDLSADALEGVDFSSMAGDLDVALLLKEGKHVLTVGAGDVEVTLDDRSDVTVDAFVSIGDVSSDEQGFSHARRAVGGQLTGALGSGEARLELRATTGDIDVKVGRQRDRSNTTTVDDNRV